MCCALLGGQPDATDGDRSDSRPCRRAARRGRRSASVSVRPRTVTYSISGKDWQRAARRDGPPRPQAWLPDPRDRPDVATPFPGLSTGERAWQPAASPMRDGDLAITYTYPRVTGTMSPDLQRRWKRFMAGVQKHEETHGGMARQMVERRRKIGLQAIRYDNDPGCRKTQAELKRRIAVDLCRIRSAADRVRRASSTARAATSKAGRRRSAGQAELRMATAE